MTRKGPRFWRILKVSYRRFFSRIDRNTPEWLQWITPYGTSLTLHGVVLVILGFFVYINQDPRPADQELDANFPQQLKEDELITSKEAVNAGDPFATTVTAEPPSLTLNPEKNPKEEILSVPQMDPKFTLAKTLNTTADSAAPSFAGLSTSTKGASTGGGPLTTPFASRGIARQGSRTVQKMGGTVKSERAVQTGLDWVVRHQGPDGGWTLDPTAHCKGTPACPKSPAFQADTGATGLALLPLLGAGHSHTDPASKYKNEIQKGINWLIKHQKPDGDLWVGGSGLARMYSQAIATMALCEAYGISGDEALKDPAQKAIDFIIGARCKTGIGGWRYEPGQEGDTCVFGWQMFALRSAALSGLKVPNSTVERCREYLDKAAVDPFKSTYCYSPNEAKGVSMIMTAEGLLCRQYLGWHRDNPAMIQGSLLVFENLSKIAAMNADELAKNEGRNIYYWYYATQLLHNIQGPAWQQWNVVVRDSLVELQVKDKGGCDQGSWDPLRPLPDKWGAQAGRHYLTCMSLLTLEVYYRYLPLYSERDRDVADVRKAASPKGRGKDAESVGNRTKADKVDKERTEKEKAAAKGK